MLNSSQLRCLEALLDTVIPPDDFPALWRPASANTCCSNSAVIWRSCCQAISSG